MAARIILASASQARRTLLEKAGVVFETVPARVDEAAVKEALRAENAPPRDIADTLAELKARKIGQRHAEAMVIGCDQVLSLEGVLLSKPATQDEARAQLRAMRAGTHELHTAAVIWEAGRPVWRKVARVGMSMRDFSDDYLEEYVVRNWDSIRHAVGAYKLEEEGIRLFSGIDGDYFAVLGLPLLEMLNYLTLRGELRR